MLSQRICNCDEWPTRQPHVGLSVDHEPAPHYSLQPLELRQASIYHSSPPESRLLSGKEKTTASQLESIHTNAEDPGLAASTAVHTVLSFGYGIRNIEDTIYQPINAANTEGHQYSSPTLLILRQSFDNTEYSIHQITLVLTTIHAARQ